MKTFGRWSVALALVAVLASACTSDPKKSTDTTTRGDSGGSTPNGLAADNDAAGSTTGITNDAINVAFIGVDFSALKSTGLVPDLGDQKKQVTSVVDDLNANGGINGRKINLHFKLLDVLSGGADAIQAACIEATQEFKAAVVVLPPAAARDLVRCTAVTNKTLTIYATGLDDKLMKEAQGRLFTPGGMSLDRQLKGWVDEIDKLGLLKGRTIGVVQTDLPGVSVVNDTLVPELDKLGHKPAQVITLPCTGSRTSCEQYDAAAQKLKDAKVDYVFMNLPNIFGPGMIEAASKIGYHPKWTFEGTDVTDTVQSFYKSVINDIDGSVGMGYAFKDVTQSSTDCNKVVTDRSGEKYEPGSDAFGFTAVVCNEFRYVDQAGDEIDKAKLNQGALIAGIEGLGTIPLGIGPDGTLSATKHDGLNFMYLCDVKASVGKCVQRPGDPVRIPDGS